MIGAYSIGSFPIGSIVQETGLAIVSLELAEATASGNNIQPLVALSLGKGEATASGLNLIPKVDLELGRGEAQGFGINFQGVGLGTTLAEATANAQNIIAKITLEMGLSEAQAQALDVVTLTKLLTDVAESSTVAYDMTQKLTLPLTQAEATAQALDLADIVYVIDDVPQIQVDRTSTQSVVKVTNPSDLKNVRIFRSEDHRGTFSTLVSNHDESSDYSDTGLDATKNYKYKCAFIVVGTKGGVEYIAVGERSAPVYTIGSNVL